MADQTFTVTEGIKAGILDVSIHANKVLGNAAGTDFFKMPNDGKTVLVMAVAASSKLITVTAVNDKYGRTETLTIQPVDSKTSIAGPFRPELWNDSDGNLKFKPAAGGLVTDIYLALRVGNPT